MTWGIKAGLRNEVVSLSRKTYSTDLHKSRILTQTVTQSLLTTPQADEKDAEENVRKQTGNLTPQP